MIFKSNVWIAEKLPPLSINYSFLGLEHQEAILKEILLGSRGFLIPIG